MKTKIIVLCVLVLVGCTQKQAVPVNVTNTTQRLLIAEELIETLNGQNLAMKNTINNQRASMDTLRFLAQRAIKSDSLSNAKAKEWGWLKKQKEKE